MERQVAIKILPDTFAHDPERLARFEREAKTLASLNHPNIAQVHGLEKADGIRALVMELVEGPTLAERIAEGPIPVDEALVIAKQIAEALEAAHEKGIVHRDLKPANIKITPEGAVKVLDFGLAKAFDGERSADPNVTHSPTLSMAATRQGIILGTAAYMSPEQARGHAVDKRADVWAFGCVLYEMLTGTAPFPGRDVTDILATVLKSEPDWATLPAETPESIRRVLRRCLEKNPKLRLREVGTAIVEIRDAETLTPVLKPRGQTAGRRSVAAAWALGAAVGAVIAGLGVWSLLRSQPAADAPVRLTLGPSTGPPVASFFGPNLAISPDGRRVVYIAATPGEGGHSLYLRDLSQLQARRLSEAEVHVPDLGFVSPFFSDDGLTVGLRSASKGIVLVPVDGGTPRKILDDQFMSGAAWASDDRIIIALADGLYRVSATGGGSPERLTPEPKEGLFYSAPALLPGERAVLFEEVRLDAAGTGASIGLLDLETREQRILLVNAVRPLYVPSGHLLFARDASLMAVAFDLATMAITGEPVPLSERVRAASFGADVRDYCVSRNGTLAYVVGATSSAAERLVWVDRRGRIVGRAVDDPIDSLREIRLSPDGNRVVAVTGRQNAGALWIYHLDGRPPLPLTEQAGNDSPIWSPDGTRVAFMSARGGTYDVYVLPADGSAVAPQTLITWGFITSPRAWLRSGDLLAMTTNIMAAPLSGASKPREVVASQFAARGPAVSPDERWLAFVSNRTGSSEVWVQAYPDGAPTRVSRSGGDEPVWSRDGHELFYRQGTRMMTVPVRTPTGRTFTFDPAEELFDEPELSRVVAVGDGRASYDVGRDGRFLMRQPVAGSQRSTTGDIVIVENWLSELRRLAPVR